MKVNVSICAAYDWYYLKNSLPIVYPHADKICISIDKNRKSWTGKSYEMDEVEFYKYIREVDTDNKIILFEDNFYVTELTPIQNECRQRQLMAEQFDEPGWFIQIDTDEYFLDFGAFCSFLKTVTNQRKINICCPFIEIYKQNEEGFFLVKPDNARQVRYIPIATRYPEYTYGRNNGYFNVKANFFVLHQSWARSESEIKQKVFNWGHFHEIDPNKSYKEWADLNVSNYKEYKDFNFLKPSLWPSLEFLRARDIPALISYFKEKEFFKLSSRQLFYDNSLFISRVKAAIRLISR